MMKKIILILGFIFIFSNSSFAQKDISEDVNVHFKWGKTYSQKGNYKKALEEYAQVLKLKPGFTGIQNEIGIVYFKQGKFDLAIREYRKALKLQPKRADIYNNLASALYYKKLYSQTIDNYNKALNLYSSKQKKEKIDVHLRLALVYTDMKNDSKVIEEYNNVVKLDHKNPKAHSGLADIYQKQGKKKLALKELKLYLKYEPIKSYHKRMHIQAIIKDLEASE